MAMHILIVEDEVSIADTLLYALEAEQFAASHVMLGSEALAFLRTNPVDFIILDIGLPDISGLEVCRKIRETSSVPILFLSAKNHEIDRIVGIEIGADDYITKPFSPREIVARVRGILRRTQHKQPTQPASNPFKLDSNQARIQYYNTWLSLTRYEYLLLKTLISQPHRIFSRVQLMDLIWIDAEETLERTVDAHIKTLRAKLHAVSAEGNPILTHRGMGYSLQMP